MGGTKVDLQVGAATLCLFSLAVCQGNAFVKTVPGRLDMAHVSAQPSHRVAASSRLPAASWSCMVASSTSTNVMR